MQVLECILGQRSCISGHRTPRLKLVIFLKAEGTHTGSNELPLNSTEITFEILSLIACFLS